VPATCTSVIDLSAPQQLGQLRHDGGDGGLGSRAHRPALDDLGPQVVAVPVEPHGDVRLRARGDRHVELRDLDGEWDERAHRCLQDASWITRQVDVELLEDP
jgi:hypothetical protein